jgi:hypothetical protein
VCSPNEIVNTIKCKKDSGTGRITPFTAYNGKRGLLVLGSSGSFLLPTNDCAGWKDVTADKYAAMWTFNDETGGAGGAFGCNNKTASGSLRNITFACCGK